jgi:hypothetical protein
MAEIYFSGQGIVYASTRDGSGNATTYRDLGNVPSLRLTLETDVLEHKESRTGNRLTDLRLTRERRARVTMTIESFSKANLMMLLYGTASSIVAGSVTNEVFPAGLAAGDMVALNFPLVKTSPSPVITGTAGGATLTAGTHYRIDYQTGMVTILNTSVGVQPYEIDYNYDAEDIVPMFRSSQVERFLRFAGLNTANSNKPVIVELYRVVFDPVGNIDLINDEFAQFEIEGSVLYDTTRDANDSAGVLGGFGRIIQAPVV